MALIALISLPSAWRRENVPRYSADAALSTVTSSSSSTASGLSNSEVAAALFVSEATVKTHVNHLLAKTGMRDRAQLVTYAFRHGLATP